MSAGISASCRDGYWSSEHVPVLGVSSHILKCGNHESSVGHQKLLFLIIPGNPGVIEYYQVFMEGLYRASGCKVPIWGLSHAGHELPPGHTANSARKIADCNANTAFSLKGQIKHKLCFIQQHIPSDVKLILIGHSIGCYIILHLLTDLQATHQVLRCFLLFPTIERMKESPKGQIATPLLKYLRWVGILIAYASSYLSPHLQYSLIQWFFKDRSVPQCVYSATMNLFNPYTINNITFMALQEMDMVSALDKTLIQRFLPKLSFYYGQDDHWCPQLYYIEMKVRYPHADIRLCEQNYDHSFVLDSSQEIADMVWHWFQRGQKKSSD